MKGIVFTVFGKMVEEKFGLKIWDQIIRETNPASGGIYTASATYSDAEVFSLIGKLSEITQTPANDLVFSFGEYLFHQLAAKYPHFLKNLTFKKFLMSIEHVIHVEVKKLYPDAGLPTFSYETPSDSELVMIYRSPRKLCRLAEGLIQGASVHLKAPYQLTHPLCMHHGSPHCRLELKFGG